MVGPGGARAPPVPSHFFIVHGGSVLVTQAQSLIAGQMKMRALQTFGAEPFNFVLDLRCLDGMTAQCARGTLAATAVNSAFSLRRQLLLVVTVHDHLEWDGSAHLQQSLCLSRKPGHHSSCTINLPPDTRLMENRCKH